MSKISVAYVEKAQSPRSDEYRGVLDMSVTHGGALVIEMDKSTTFYAPGQWTEASVGEEEA